MRNKYYARPKTFSLSDVTMPRRSWASVITWRHESPPLKQRSRASVITWRRESPHHERPAVLGIEARIYEKKKNSRCAEKGDPHRSKNAFTNTPNLRRQLQHSVRQKQGTKVQLRQRNPWPRMLETISEPRVPQRGTRTSRTPRETASPTGMPPSPRRRTWASSQRSDSKRGSRATSLEGIPRAI